MIALRSFGILPVLLLYMVFPLTYSVGKWGLQYGPYALYVALRMLLGGTAIMIWYCLFKRSSMVIKKQDIYYFVAIGIVAFCLSFIAECVSLPHLTVGKIALYFALAPFFTALFASFHKLEIITPRKLVGLTVGFCGFVPQLFVDNATGCSGAFSFGLYDMIMLGASATYAYGWILIKKLSHRTEYDDAWVNGIGMLVGGTAALCLTVYNMLHVGGIAITDYFQFIGSIGLVTAISMFCYLLYTALLHHFTTTLVSFFCFLEVPFSLLFGFIFLREQISYIFFISTAIIVLGLYIFYQEELRLRR